jgi:hypothetical protein
LSEGRPSLPLFKAERLQPLSNPVVCKDGASAGVCVAVLLSLRKVGPFLICSPPAPENGEASPCFPFLALYYRRANNRPTGKKTPMSSAKSVPRQARFTPIFLQPFQKASAFSDPSTVFWSPNSHLYNHCRRLGAPVNSTSGLSAKRQLPDRPGECCPVRDRLSL